MTYTSTEFHARLLAEDLERLMPGCDISARSSGSGLDAFAIHRVTGLRLGVTVEDDRWTVYTDSSATTGSSAYGFDSAVVHAYRHHLDFTGKHGPGTAHEYAGAVCQIAGCATPATHRSGWRNGTTEHGPSLNCCVPHTNERENDGAWSRSLS